MNTGYFNGQLFSTPGNQAVIDPWAFSGCALRKADIPEGVVSIRNNAFSWSAVRKVTLPKSVTNLETSVFCDCKKLKKAVVLSEVESLSSGMFSGCTKLKKLELPDTLQCISVGAIYDTKILNQEMPGNLYFWSKGFSLNTVYDSTDEYDPECVIVFNRYTNALYNCGNGEETSISLQDPKFFYDPELETIYTSQQSGIPIELLETPYEENLFYINNIAYSFPLSIDEFLKKDYWEICEDKEEDGWTFVENSNTKLYLDLNEDKTMVCGFATNLSEEYVDETSCPIVLPGGIATHYTRWYRPVLTTHTIPNLAGNRMRYKIKNQDSIYEVVFSVNTTKDMIEDVMVTFSVD